MIGTAKCTVIVSKNGTAKEQADSLNKLDTSKLINPMEMEKVRNCIGHGISNVMVNAVNICNHP